MAAKHIIISFTLNDKGRIPGETTFRKQWSSKVKCQSDISVYVYFHNNDIIYIGESSNPVNRLVKGFNAAPSTTISYKWKKNYTNKDLTAHIFTFDPPKTQKTSLQVIRRSIEAEIVYAVRAISGQWPLEQHEIHFGSILGKSPYVIKARNFMLSELGI